MILLLVAMCFQSELQMGCFFAMKSGLELWIWGSVCVRCVCVCVGSVVWVGGGEDWNWCRCSCTFLRQQEGEQAPVIRIWFENYNLLITKSYEKLVKTRIIQSILFRALPLVFIWCHKCKDTFTIPWLWHILNITKKICLVGLWLRYSNL